MWRFHLITTESINISFSIEIFIAKEKRIGYFLLQKYNFNGENLDMKVDIQI